MKRGRACGEDGIRAEFWLAVLVEGCSGAHWLVDFCQKCWEGSSIPHDWHVSLVASIFKKGDPADCGNYRPISLLNIGYKIFAGVLLNRLRTGGAEGRIWETQFGFRQHHDTEHALLIARRHIEQAWAMKDGSVMMVALDWAKAFDSINPQGLITALTRSSAPNDQGRGGYIYWSTILCEGLWLHFKISLPEVWNLPGMPLIAVPLLYGYDMHHGRCQGINHATARRSSL